MVDYPAGLPYKSNLDTVQVAERHVPHKTMQTESGVMRGRRQSMTTIQKMPYCIVLESTEQFGIFDDFYMDDIAQGLRRFRMLVPVQGETYAMRTVKIEPNSLTYKPQGGDIHFAFFTLNIFMDS